MAGIRAVGSKGQDITYHAEPWLAALKPFQRATVDTVFSRLFTDEDPTDRFLVADEAGLGKTMVARGVIAKTVERLQHEKERTTVVYLCSSQSIAAQNLKSLDVVGAGTRLLNTRPTLLPLRTGERGQGKVDMLSLTPGTALDLKSSLGRADERALIYEMLRERLGIRHKGVMRFFRGTVGVKNWPTEVQYMRGRKICPDHATAFNNAVEEDLLDRIRESAEFRRYDPYPDYPDPLRPAPMIGDLRRRLARICLRRLAPDLVIIDEFQRFADLLHDHDPQIDPAKAEAAALAQTLFTRGGIESAPRVLLLSATPYRMVTLKSDAEEDGDHYGDFIRTLGFLFDEPETGPRSTALKADLRVFRTAMQGLPQSAPIARAAKYRIEAALRSVMSRTERVTATAERDAMILSLAPPVTLEKDDLKEAEAVSRIARALDAPGIVEYWKSAPYLLSVMRDYKMGQALREAVADPSDALCEALRGAKPFTVSKKKIKNFDALPSRNGRMRALERILAEEGLGRALWLPPCRPSFGEARAATKTLVFSDWSMVPDAIAALISHGASREMGMERDVPFSTSNIDTMLPVLYPCITLAQHIDPLQIEAERGRASSLKDWRRQTRDTIRDRLDARVLAKIVPAERLTALRLDRAFGKGSDWKQRLDRIDASKEKSLHDAVEAIRDAMDQLPRRPERDTGRHDLLIDLVLGSPAICALRALMRVAPTLDPTEPAFSMAALRIALAFRSLFDQPESSRLLANGKGPHWRRILDWCVAHDLPAVLDEYVHLLNDSHADEPDNVTRIGRIAESMADAIALRPAEITVNRLSTRAGSPEIVPMRMKARFAMRFATDAEDDKGIVRTGLVQAAFKSPFRPFVLATTSIGQEGLDFHSYCARVVHWNLPRNPVDIEQREGRVHRYKNHCVRRNLAAAQGTGPFGYLGDPWHRMFKTAMQQEREAGRAGDLIPFWVHEGDGRIERVTLLPPMSREVRRYDRLMRSLATYRLAFGQPRQTELLDLLGKVQKDIEVDISDFQIDLRPRRR